MSKVFKQYSCGPSKKQELLKYSRAEVALHNTEKDLWLIINGKIYNFSGYAKSHPGGDQVFYDCAGKDATEVYDDSEHPSWVDSQLVSYLVGEVIEEEPEILKPIQQEATLFGEQDLSDEVSTRSGGSTEQDQKVSMIPDEIIKHKIIEKGKEDLWLIINDKVYDASSTYPQMNGEQKDELHLVMQQSESINQEIPATHQNLIKYLQQNCKRIGYIDETFSQPKQINRDISIGTIKRINSSEQLAGTVVTL